MPIYEFACHPCDYKVEELRTLCDYTRPDCPQCSTPMEWIMSASTMHVWDSSDKFPNLSNHGDGTMTFGSKKEYKNYLKANHVAESAHDAPVKTPHTAEVKVYE